MTPPPTKTTEPGCSRSVNTSSEVIISSAPGNGSCRGFEPVATTMCFASRTSLPAATAFSAMKRPLVRTISAPIFRSEPARRSGRGRMISALRSIIAAQSSRARPTLMWCAPACAISCSVCAAATRTFFGVQPRLEQVPPNVPGSSTATESPALRVRSGHAHAGIATADHHHVELARRHWRPPSIVSCVAREHSGRGGRRMPTSS